MFNADRVFAHRGLILTALIVYKRKVGSVIKGEKEIEADTDDTERKLEIIEILRAEFLDPAALKVGMEGTPLGDMIGANTMIDEDGTVLTADNLEGLLRRCGVDAPFDHITAWTLDQRKIINAYRKAREIFILDQTSTPPAVPDIIAESWIRRTGDDVLEQELDEEQIAGALDGGPWYVRADPEAVSPADAEWQVVAAVVMREGEEKEIVHGHYGQLDRARLIAANLCIIEKAFRATRDAAALAAKEAQERADTDKKPGDDADDTAPETPADPE